MAERTKISWATSTWNPWLGCTNVSPGCDRCYAEALAKRTGMVEWGNRPRRRTSAAYWRQPLAWNRKAAASGQPWRVFCASIADVFDNQADDSWRDDMWHLIHETQCLTWMLLTKRPQNIAQMLPRSWGDGWRHVWLGCTAENQEEAARRIPHLLAVPARVRFLSCEPLLGPIDLCDDDSGPLCGGSPSAAQIDGARGMHYLRHGSPRIDWIIAGGESGPGARPMQIEWARSLRDQCAASGTPFFMKQMAKRERIPDDLMIREFPDAR